MAPQMFTFIPPSFYIRCPWQAVVIAFIPSTHLFLSSKIHWFFLNVTLRCKMKSPNPCFCQISPHLLLILLTHISFINYCIFFQKENGFTGRYFSLFSSRWRYLIITCSGRWNGGSAVQKVILQILNVPLHIPSVFNLPCFLMFFSSRIKISPAWSKNK